MNSRKTIALYKRNVKKRAWSINPHECVVLAVDTAKRSGWSVFVRGTYDCSGDADITKPASLDFAVSSAFGVAADHGLRSGDVVLVLERSWGGNSGAREALGAARFAWEQAWARRRGVKSRTVRVYPATWRSRLFGTTKGTLEYERRRARLTSKKVGEMSQDECAAVCIGNWASHAGEVAALLPRRASE